VLLEDLVKACGVEEVKIMDPYNLEDLTRTIKEAGKGLRSENGGITVIISKHPCLMSPGVSKTQGFIRLAVTDDCVACGICFQDFECPAMNPDPQNGMARIDQNLCSGCGVCIKVCPQGAIKRT